MKRQPTKWKKIFANGVIGRGLYKQLIQFNNQNQVKWSRSVVSDSLRPQRLYSPWNSPGQNTGVGNFLSPGDLPNPGIEPGLPSCRQILLSSEPEGKPKQRTEKSCPTLCDPGLHGPWNSPSQNTGMGNLSLLQGIFPTQDSNPGHSHCRQILYQLNHKGNPKPNNVIKKWAEDLNRHIF